MAMHAAFLRGINVGGHKATKDQLRMAFERAGLGEVSTYRASGNVLFDAGSRKPDPEAIEAELERELGYRAPVFLRSARQLAAIAAFEPFTSAQLAASHGKLQVSFLGRRPPMRAMSEALALATRDDPLRIDGSELYWLPRGKMCESGLDLRALERLVGTWTMRTMGTVEQIAERLGG